MRTTAKLARCCLPSLAFLLGACQSSATGPTNQLTGSYHLQTVNGAFLPTAATRGGSSFRVVYGDVVLREYDMSFDTETTITQKTASGGDTTIIANCTGKITLQADSVAFTESGSSQYPSCGGIYKGSLSNGILVIWFDPGFQAVYIKTPSSGHYIC